MSYLKFIDDLCKEEVTTKKLEDIWNNHNLVNKSLLIDKLTMVLKTVLENRESIPVDMMKKIAQEYEKFEVVSKIVPTKPILEDLPSPLENSNGCKYNPQTGFVFKPRSENPQNPRDWVVIKVYVSGQYYDLVLKHINICISNGWIFRTNIEGITCPFKE